MLLLLYHGFVESERKNLMKLTFPTPKTTVRQIKYTQALNKGDQWNSNIVNSASFSNKTSTDWCIFDVIKAKLIIFCVEKYYLVEMGVH